MCSSFPPLCHRCDSEDHPGEHIERVVIARSATGAIVVARTAVELCIHCVLHTERKVGPGTEAGVGLAERHVVGLKDERIAVGLAIGASGQRTWRIQQRVILLAR